MLPLDDEHGNIRLSVDPFPSAESLAYIALQTQYPLDLGL